MYVYTYIYIYIYTLPDKQTTLDMRLYVSLLVSGLHATRMNYARVPHGTCGAVPHSRDTVLQCQIR